MSQVIDWIRPWTRTPTLVLVDRAGTTRPSGPLFLPSQWPTFLCTIAEAQRVAALPGSPWFFAQELGGKKGWRVLSAMYRVAQHCVTITARFSCSHYYIIILYRDFRRGSFVPRKGVLCVATCTAGFVPLLSVHPGAARALWAALCSRVLLPRLRLHRPHVLPVLFNIYMYIRAAR